MVPCATLVLRPANFRVPLMMEQRVLPTQTTSVKSVCIHLLLVQRSLLNNSVLWYHVTRGKAFLPLMWPVRFVDWMKRWATRLERLRMAKARQAAFVQVLRRERGHSHTSMELAGPRRCRRVFTRGRHKSSSVRTSFLQLARRIVRQLMFYATSCGSGGVSQHMLLVAVPQALQTGALLRMLEPDLMPGQGPARLDAGQLPFSPQRPAPASRC